MEYSSRLRTGMPARKKNDEGSTRNVIAEKNTWPGRLFHERGTKALDTTGISKAVEHECRR